MHKSYFALKNPSLKTFYIEINSKMIILLQSKNKDMQDIDTLLKHK